MAEASVTAEPREAAVAEEAVTAEPGEPETTETTETAEPKEAEAVAAEPTVTAEPAETEVAEPDLAEAVAEAENVEVPEQWAEPETATAEPTEPENVQVTEAAAEVTAPAEPSEPEVTETTPQVPAQRTEIEASELDITVVSEATEPETQAEPAQATQPEPAQEAEPEPAEEPQAKAAQEAQPEPAQATQPELAQQTRPEAAEEPQPAPAEATAEPEAADGEDTPQGPPAPDNESRTGGAGGNQTAADGEAEADQAKHPAPAEGENRAGGNQTPAEGEAEADQAQATPANDTPATTALAKADLATTPAKTYLVLDRSASMRPYYKDGSAQALADQALALAAELDKATPAIHVVFFSTEVDGTTDLTPDTTQTVDDMHATLGRMGRTSYHAAVEAVLAHYDKHHTPADKALVIFQTDGAPDAKTPATQALTNAAKTHPNVFFSFVAFGEHDNKAFDYLRKLKTPNTSFFHAGPTPRELTDAELYEGVLAGWRP
ncbi:VWA domain-containing protein [Streptomyces sp. NPDC048242]|uniref:VWA domain-containing protein n=1 Tax=Streptomyces sp. NPDC048242 TaxID=3155026 RepID=UPI00344ABC88